MSQFAYDALGLGIWSAFVLLVGVGIGFVWGARTMRDYHLGGDR